MKKVLKITAIVLSTVLFILCLSSFVIIIISSMKNDVPLIFNHSLMSLTTKSMEPNYKVGDLVVVKKVDADTLKEGDVISFYSTDPAILGMPNTHRILKINGSGSSISFVTKGDNNPVEDDYSVEPANLIGKVVLKIPSVGKAILFLQNSRAVYFLVIILPMFVIFLFEMRNVIKKSREVKEDK